MLPNGFANLANDRPDLRDALSVIEAWCDKHQMLSAIDPRRIAHEVPLSPATLTEALFFLVDEGVLRQVYKFEAPDGSMLGEAYDDFLDVPDYLQNRFDEKVERQDGEVVPVFCEPC